MGKCCIPVLRTEAQFVMKRNFASASNPFVLASYALLLVGLALAIITLRFNLHLALLPAAVIFGWTQIGGV